MARPFGAQPLQIRHAITPTLSSLRRVCFSQRDVVTSSSQSPPQFPRIVFVATTPFRPTYIQPFLSREPI
jgi:hypothetical protein